MEQEIVYTCLENVSSSSDNTSTLVNNIHSLLATVVDQNNTLIEENKKLKEENKKMLSYFTEEFIALRRTVEQAMAELKAQQFVIAHQNTLKFETAEDIALFDNALKQDEDKRLDLIAKFNKQRLDNISEFIHENLKLIFNEDHITAKFSWSSAKGNLAVKDFTFIKLLKDLAVENMPQTSGSQVEELIKKFFNMSKDRMNKAEKRKRSN